ncbi:MAG TPA: hypothetical protein VK145_02645 [Candidatus Nanoarchaeia archaeon]|nr:hypothetical protein [Candidatus Nanoarchaeia archaeon]
MLWSPFIVLTSWINVTQGLCVFPQYLQPPPSIAADDDGKNNSTKKRRKKEGKDKTRVIAKERSSKRKRLYPCNNFKNPEDDEEYMLANPFPSYRNGNWAECKIANPAKYFLGTCECKPDN